MALDLRAVFRWSGRDFDRGIDRSRAKVKELRAEMQRSFLGAAAGVFSAGAFAGMTKGAIEAAVEIDRLAQKFSLSRRRIQEMALAGNIDFGTLDNALESLSERLVQVFAQGQTGEVKDAFDALGITASDFRRMSLDQLFVKIGDAVRKMPNTITQTASVMQVMGDTASALVPAFKSGIGAGIESMNGLTLATDDAIERAARLSAEIGKIKLQLTGPLLEILTVGLKAARGVQFIGEASAGAVARGLGAASAGSPMAFIRTALYESGRGFQQAVSDLNDSMRRLDGNSSEQTKVLRSVERELKKTL